MNEERLLTSQIFKGLTRPPMVFGVTLDYLALAAMLAICLFVLAGNPLYAIVYVPLHVFGWIACKIDPNMFIVLLKNSECSHCPNKSYWRSQSYEPY